MSEGRQGSRSLPQVPVSLLASLFLIDKFPVPMRRGLRQDVSGFRAFSRTRSGLRRRESAIFPVFSLVSGNSGLMVTETGSLETAPTANYKWL
jgi:hypothetical protein